MTGGWSPPEARSCTLSLPAPPGQAQTQTRDNSSYRDTCPLRVVSGCCWSKNLGIYHVVNPLIGSQPTPSLLLTSSGPSNYWYQSSHHPGGSHSWELVRQNNWRNFVGPRTRRNFSLGRGEVSSQDLSASHMGTCGQWDLLVPGQITLSPLSPLHLSWAAS